MARPKVEFHKTAEDILISAQKHFLEKGFSGTSINDIAKDANINKSLIYHHYGSKEGLWKAVKKHILEQQMGINWDEVSFATSSLKDFLEDFITFRFNLYGDHPELVRLMGWQRLEPQGEDLSGVSHPKAIHLEKEILELQEKGEIRKDISLEIINYMIFSSASNGFMDNAKFLKSKKGQEEYLKVIKEALMRTLKPV